jgi:GTP-binding protein
VAEWEQRLGRGVPVIATSSATGVGLGELAETLLRGVQETASREPVGLGAAAHEREEQLAEHMVFRPAAATGFRVEQLGPGSFAVRGTGIERLLRRYDVENEDAMAYMEGRLRRIGVLKALEDEGFKAGDEVRIGDTVLEFST